MLPCLLRVTTIDFISHDTDAATTAEGTHAAEMVHLMNSKFPRSEQYPSMMILRAVPSVKDLHFEVSKTSYYSAGPQEKHSRSKWHPSTTVRMSVGPSGVELDGPEMDVEQDVA